ncbi:hypothetical protein L336_0855 [Candidatus Saccharimonas aalborgensis]|uniref:Uncharacterized protein n=1 Tax=Candidatus Saccharimonas aalborgensis TaxID=1332188 RepID=R4PXR8_9BACT|nr:hypothetical protein L336_0855 [Candidatus Saccharimonas aalborgensis]
MLDNSANRSNVSIVVRVMEPRVSKGNALRLKYVMELRPKFTPIVCLEHREVNA